MKRIKYLCFCSIAVFMLTACGSSSSKNEEEKITVTGTDGKEYTSYQEACRAGDFEAAHAFLDIIMNAEVGREKQYKFESDKEKAYNEAKMYVLNKEVEFLVSQNSDEANNRLIFLLNEDASPTPVPEDALISYNYPEEMGAPNRTEFDNYSKWISDRNNLCDKILDNCILLNNSDLANKIINMYKPDAISVKKDLGKKGFENRAHFTDDSKNKAIKKLQDAIKSGALK
jgi:hypothetical protein